MAQIEVRGTGADADEIANFQRDGTGLRRRLLEQLARRAADDHFHQLLRRSLIDWLLAHQLSVAQHRNPIRNAENLVQPVRDINHADPARLQLTDGGEQALHFVGGETCGGLIQHQHVGLDSQRAGNGDQRFLCAGEALHAQRRIEVAADKLERGLGARLGGAPVDQTATHGKPLGKTHVLGDCHPLDQAEILVDEGHRLALIWLGRTMRVRRAAEQDLARVRHVYARKRLDQRRFSGAVLAQ